MVVLPFVDMSPGKDQEYFCHGVTEEIISTLTPRSRDACDLANVGVRLSGQGCRGHRDRPAVARRHGARGQRAQGRRPRAHHGAARERRATATRSGRSVSIASSRTSSRFRTRSPRPSSTSFGSESAAASAGERASLDVAAHDAYLQGMYALNKWTEDGDAAGHRRLPRSHRAGRRLRACLRRARRGLRLALLGPGHPAGARDGAAGAMRRSSGRWSWTRRWPTRTKCARSDRDEPRLGSKGAERGARRARSSSVRARRRRISGTPGGSRCSSGSTIRPWSSWRRPSGSTRSICR